TIRKPRALGFAHYSRCCQCDSHGGRTKIGLCGRGDFRLSADMAVTPLRERKGRSGVTVPQGRRSATEGAWLDTSWVTARLLKAARRQASKSSRSTEASPVASPTAELKSRPSCVLTPSRRLASSEQAWLQPLFAKATA